MSEPVDKPSDRENGNGAVISPLQTLRNWVRAVRRPRNSEHLRDAIGELIGEEEGEQALIDEDERRLLKNILHLHDITVADVMVPRADIVAVEDTVGLDELVKLMSEKSHSRIPVYRGTLDDVIGMVHIKDVVASVDSKQRFKLSRILREVLFAVPSMRVLDLLLEMRTTHNHMALVVDEFGGVDGLATIEDLVEEIVGEIEDEHDYAAEPLLVEEKDGAVTADARATIEEFEARFGGILTEEEREDIDTLGGLVFALAGRVPARGELIRHPSGLEFEVIEADPRKIKRLRVRQGTPRAPSP